MPGAVGFTVTPRGAAQAKRGLRQLERKIVNETRKEMRQALRPLVLDMRAAAPVRSGKLRSSVKQFTTSSLGFGIRWGGKASASAVRRFLAEYGTPGARGGTWLTPGRIAEAYYVHAVAIHNKWAQPVIARHVGRIQREVQQRTGALADKYNREFKVS